MLHGSRISSKIDLLKAFYQIRPRYEEIPKTAILTPFRLYEFTYMTNKKIQSKKCISRSNNSVIKTQAHLFAEEVKVKTHVLIRYLAVKVVNFC